MNQEIVLRADPRALARVQTDALIAGAGAAGLYAALHLDRKLRCALLTKAGAQVSNSMYAQGGLSAVTQYDDGLREGHIEDTILAGAGLCDEAAVRVLVCEAADRVQELLALGVPFDQKDGELLRTQEGGHRQRRILHCGGDATGLHLTGTLLGRARARENIAFYDGLLISDILTDAHGVAGALCVGTDGAPWLFETRRIILATGGIGRLYPGSTNAACATGDGMAAAARAGAALRHMEFVQFHPTVLAGQERESRVFLISEAVRGEGARLRNGRGEYFLQGVHPMADLAPRDIVARAIVRELQRTGEGQVYLDIAHQPAAFLAERFPTIYAECLRQGIDMARDCIPVRPLQHYMMGGVATGLFGETGIPGLYACGETACTGVHGANRLASNSLLECIVFGKRAAQHCMGISAPRAQPGYAPPPGPARPLPAEAYAQIAADVRRTMGGFCGIIRDGQGLSAACARLEALEARARSGAITGFGGAEALNMAQKALAVARAARARRRSVGAHFRSDSEEET